MPPEGGYIINAAVRAKELGTSLAACRAEESAMSDRSRLKEHSSTVFKISDIKPHNFGIN